MKTFTGLEFNYINKNKEFIAIEEPLNKFRTGLNIVNVVFDSKFQNCSGGIIFKEFNKVDVFNDFMSNNLSNYRFVTIPDNGLVYGADDFFMTNSLILSDTKNVSDLKLWDNHCYCLYMVKLNGLNLRYIDKQTDELCLEAVRQNGLALEFVKNQTPDMCDIARQQNSGATKFVNLVLCDTNNEEKENLVENNESSAFVNVTSGDTAKEEKPVEAGILTRMFNFW